MTMCLFSFMWLSEPLCFYIKNHHKFQELISLGANKLVVPGNFPIGCVPLYLAIFPSQKEDYYDEQTGCIKWLNEFAEYHNKMLQEELERLRNLHPDVTIIYADYYGASLNIFRAPLQFGEYHFKTNQNMEYKWCWLSALRDNCPYYISWDMKKCCKTLEKHIHLCKDVMSHTKMRPSIMYLFIYILVLHFSVLQVLPYLFI